MPFIAHINKDNLEQLKKSAEMEKKIAERKKQDALRWKADKKVDSKYIRYEKPEQKQQ